MSTQRPPLSTLLPPLVLGGAGFSNQLSASVPTLPVRSIISRAFALGFRCIDTSPYYHPSEELLGDALSQPDFVTAHPRESYLLMTKVGRITSDTFDYSPSWVRKSVAKSLERMRTTYLDVVFCHDIEFVTDEEAVEAVGVLWEFVEQGQVRYVGLSSYRLDKLVRVAGLCREKYGRGVDVVQNWGQLTLQNTRLETAEDGLAKLREVGVTAVCSSSPLAIGLLRQGGVPVGSLGDFHPAPAGLRKAAQRAAEVVAERGEDLATLALRFSMSRAAVASQDGFCVSTITGVGSISDLEENVATAKMILKASTASTELGDARELILGDYTVLNEEQVRKDAPLYDLVQQTLGSWLDYNFDA